MITNYKKSKYLILIFLQFFLIFLLYACLKHFIGYYQSENHLEFSGLIVEVLALAFIFLVCLTVTNNLILSIIISNLLYLMIVAISLIKISYLSFPIVYYDLFQVNDLLLNLGSINTYILLYLAVLACVIATAFIYAIFKSRKNNFRIFSSITLVLFVVFLSFTSQNVKNYFSTNNIKYKWNSNIYIKTQKYGILTFFIQSIYFSNKLEKPRSYSLSQANKYLSESDLSNLDWIEDQTTTPDNVIVLLVESFQDSKQLPWKTNLEITPTYNKLKLSGHSGYLISPVYGGKSINAEFELLTGFSNIFVPPGSIPYKDFIHHQIPSIAWQFKENNFTTNAIQVVEMKGYGYSSIYEHLGFDKKFSISKFNKKVELDPTKRFGSSNEISTKINELITTQAKSFIFAFPNSSHSPWKINDYPNNKIKLLNHDLKPNVSNEIIAYYNSMIHIDSLFESLITKIDKTEKTIILIIGDHQPALKVNSISTKNKWTFEDKLNDHFVPYLFWSNYDVEFPSSNERFTSMNFIGLTLLKISNIKPKGFYAFLDTVKDEFTAFSFALLKDNEVFRIKDLRNSETVRKYQSVQYKYLSNDAN